MNNSVLLEKANLGKRLLAYGLDILSTLISTIILYFIVLYSIFSGMGYISNSHKINEYNVQYNLDYRFGEGYKTYKEVIDKFYFEYFKDDILNDFNVGDKKISIEHIYNVVILNLPENPTHEINSNGLYEYQSNPDGSYNVDVIAKQINGNGPYFEKNLEDLFYYKYTKLPALLRKYTPDYDKCFRDNSLYEDISRVIALSTSVIVFYIVIPFINKKSSTLSEKYVKIGYANNKDCLAISNYKVFLRPVIYYTLPIIGVYFFTAYSIVCLSILPFFINLIVMLLNHENKDMYEIFTKVTACDLETSNIFESEIEKNEFMKSEQIEDENYLNRLKEVTQINALREEKNEK